MCILNSDGQTTFHLVEIIITCQKQTETASRQVSCLFSHEIRWRRTIGSNLCSEGTTGT